MKKIVIISLGACTVVITTIIFLVLSSIPMQDYALSVDPVISKGDFGIYTHVVIKNTGRQPITNVKVDYGSQVKPDLIPMINPGNKIMLSPPDGSDLSQVRVTADNGIDIVVPYRSPASAPIIGNGGFGQ